MNKNKTPDPVFRHDLHIELWDWLSKNPTKQKRDWPGFNGESYPDHGCFACDYDRALSRTYSAYCKSCPFRDSWSFPDSCPQFQCEHPDSPYHKWHATFSTGIPPTSEALRLRSHLARKIRDLPLRDDWDWKNVKAPE